MFGFGFSGFMLTFNVKKPSGKGLDSIKKDRFWFSLSNRLWWSIGVHETVTELEHVYLSSIQLLDLLQLSEIRVFYMKGEATSLEPQISFATTLAITTTNTHDLAF